jgi:hypothetical protein
MIWLAIILSTLFGMAVMLAVVIWILNNPYLWWPHK